MDVFADNSSLRAHLQAQRPARTIAFVPTMGALHDGHRACIDVARRVDRAHVVVSIFVNPTQFGPSEDLDRYPRDLESDVALCRDWGCDTVFAPPTGEIYPSPQRCWVEVEGVSEPLCGRNRPGHFRGVATVVAKLFEIVGPDVAVFGQKDAQQALVIREMVRQLNMPVALRLARIAREPDGLARSSRNAYLAPAARARAAGIYAALRHGAGRLEAGERDPAALVASVRAFLEAQGAGNVEYAEVLAAEDLSPLDAIAGRVILAVAVHLDGTRLIDNMVFDVGDGSVETDVDLF